MWKTKCPSGNTLKQQSSSLFEIIAGEIVVKSPYGRRKVHAWRRGHRHPGPGRATPPPSSPHMCVYIYIYIYIHITYIISLSLSLYIYIYVSGSVARGTETLSTTKETQTQRPYHLEHCELKTDICEPHCHYIIISLYHR